MNSIQTNKVQVENKIGVVYLMWLPFGKTYFYSFINSYLQYPAGAEHELIICFNGVHADNDLIDYYEILQKNGINAIVFKIKQGQDIDCYVHISRNTDYAYLLFLNTYSVLLKADWLQKYFHAFSKPNVGLVSATASLQSYYSSVFQQNSWQWEMTKDFRYNWLKYKLLLKAFFYWRFLFNSFPNPHVRSNAFMIRRKEFLGMNTSAFTSKFKAYLFESGKKSLTNYYLKLGMSVLLLDKNARVYEPSEWKSGKTFWISEQENLLVSDNQTRLYSESDEKEKKTMTKLAWGDE